MSASASAKPGDKIPSSEIQVIRFPADQIDPSPYQARKHFPQESIDEMAASIAARGVLQPLICRVVDPRSGRLELVIGERRLRGTKQAGIPDVPVLVMEYSDTDAAEVLLIENLQREDLSESDEANGLNKMLELKKPDGGALYTVESLAAKLNKTVDHVNARLKLLLCPKELIEAVDSGLVKISTAQVVGRIPDPKARAECARLVLTPETQQVPLNYEQTKELVRERFMVQLKKKDFDLDREGLVPLKLEGGVRVQGGACTNCPFRSGMLEGVEVKGAASESGKAGGGTRGVDPNLCTLPRCHKLKLDAAWREKKSQAQREGLKTLDGDDAVRAFSGHNGALAHNSGFVDLNERVGWIGNNHHNETWKDALKGQSLPVVLARHPETNQVLQVLVKKDAVAGVEAAEVAAKKAEKDKPKTPAQAREEEKEKQRRSEELQQQKLDKLTVSEGLGDIVKAVTEKGMGVELLEYVFQMALDSSGVDGMYFLGHWFDIKLPKGTNSGGRSYEEDIIKLVKERAQTPNAWLAYTVVALLAQQIKWHGVDSEDLEGVLKLVGIKIPELERRAKALLAVDQKPKGKGKSEAPTTKGTSTDPVDVSADQQGELSLAADKQAKAAAYVAALDKRAAADGAKAGNDKIVLCEFIGASQALMFFEAVFGRHVPETMPNEKGIYIQRASFTLDLQPGLIGIELAHTGNGTWAWGNEARIGKFDVGTYPAQDDAHGSRATAVAEAARDLLLQHAAAEKRSTAPPLPTVVKNTLQTLVEAADRKAKEESGAASSVKEGSIPKGGFAKGPAKNKTSAKPSASGASGSELITGIQASKLGKPGAFTEADVKAAAAAIVAQTATITALIGQKPKPADKTNYNAWSRVRMQILRMANSLSGAEASKIARKPEAGGKKKAAAGKGKK